MITPAISVLSAVEGLKVVAPELDAYIVPITMAILIGLFSVQKKGTASVGVVFGPVMLVWFGCLLAMGLHNIHLHPDVLKALNPYYAAAFMAENKLLGFLALGAVVLVVTGAEALYADMGHFGRWPIRMAWLLVVLPSLVINYFGQGALLLADPAAIHNPFYLMAPLWARMPLLVLATMATVIASQAVISGAFSLTQQAIQLGFLPRMEIIHTSERERGQIYLPFVNWALLFMVLCLVIGFQSSSNLASAYGIAVTGSMAIDSILVGLVMAKIWGWSGALVKPLIGAFLVMDLSFFFANAGQDPPWRLVPARRGADPVPAAHHLEARPRAGARAPHPGCAADRDFSRIRRRKGGAGEGYGDVPGWRKGRRAHRAPAQPQAQPGAARARRAARDRCGRAALRAHRGPHHRVRARAQLPPHRAALRLHGRRQRAPRRSPTRGATNSAFSTSR